MKQIKLFVIMIAVVTLMLPILKNVYAREGRSGGGWSGGRGDGEYCGGGDEHRGEGERRGQDNRYDHHDWGWGWGAADTAIAGVAVGEAVQPTTVIVDQSSATGDQQSAPNAPAYGTDVTVLPSGAVSRNVHGITAYQCGSVWYRPYFGSNGVYYEVVAPPPPDNQ